MAKITRSYGFPVHSMPVTLPGGWLDLLGGLADPPQQAAPVEQVLYNCRGSRVQGVEDQAGHLCMEEVVKGKL